MSVDRPRPSFTALRDWLVEHIAAELKLPSDAVAPDARLDSFALQSISVAALQAGLSDWLGFRVPHTVFLEHPTIDAMAEALGGTTVPASSSPSTLLLGLTAARPFFCVGGALGAAYYLLPLARDVGSARPFYGLRAPGYDGSEAPLERDGPATARGRRGGDPDRAAGRVRPDPGPAAAAGRRGRRPRGTADDEPARVRLRRSGRRRDRPVAGGVGTEGAARAVPRRERLAAGGGAHHQHAPGVPGQPGGQCPVPAAPVGPEGDPRQGDRRVPARDEAAPQHRPAAGQAGQRLGGRRPR
ncbi:MAG: hypothetical protein E6G35_12140 [Actinobacteria bacterium]|nr:MAG: hypothetical protein E6G35_12140 [Actinomycetota bacterium]